MNVTASRRIRPALAGIVLAQLIGWVALALIVLAIVGGF